MGTIDLGRSIKQKPDLEHFLNELNGKEYKGSNYELFSHNCNNFTNELTKFLTVNKEQIPSHILNLPTTMLKE